MILENYDYERNKLIDEISRREDYQGQIFASLNKFWYRDLDLSPHSSYADIYCTYVCRLGGNEVIGHLFIDVVPILTEDYPLVLKDLNKKFYDRMTQLKKTKEELVNERRVLVISEYKAESVSLERLKEMFKKHGVRICIINQSEEEEEEETEE
jgi:hypothetical protein